MLQAEIHFKIKYVHYDSVKHELQTDHLKTLIDKNTFAVALATTTNVFGTTFDVIKVGQLIKAKNKETLFIVDAAQSIVHYQFDVQLAEVDFLYFSTHKAYGPQGLAVLYARTNQIEKMKPLIVGGGSAFNIGANDQVIWHDPPALFEAGSPNMMAIFG